MLIRDIARWGLALTLPTACQTGGPTPLPSSLVSAVETAELPPLWDAPDSPQWLSEFRVGIQSHDVGLTGHTHEDGENLALEVLFPEPADLLPAPFAPSPILGVSLNRVGDTSHGYAGITWQFDLFHPRVFWDLALGVAVHNGKVNRHPGHAALGSRVLFRESIAIGYRLTDTQSLALAFDHISNANLANYNDGIDTIGVRYGIRF